MKPNTLEVIFTWDDGREELRYSRPLDSADAAKFMAEVDELKRKYPDTPYSYRKVFAAR